MPVIELQSHIDAPAEVCFDLTRNMDLLSEFLKPLSGRAVSGFTQGLIGPGDHVIFNFGFLNLFLELKSEIVEYKRPVEFCDRHTSRLFSRSVHTHIFEPAGNGTCMRENYEFEFFCRFLSQKPFILVVMALIRWQLARKMRLIKQIAERGRYP